MFRSLFEIIAVAVVVIGLLVVALGFGSKPEYQEANADALTVPVLDEYVRDVCVDNVLYWTAMNSSSPGYTVKIDPTTLLPQRCDQKAQG